MSTADEILVRMAYTKLRVDAFAAAMTEALITGLSAVLGVWRTISPKRARKLRKRGELVVYAGRTATGKALYRWYFSRQVDIHKQGLT